MKSLRVFHFLIPGFCLPLRNPWKKKTRRIFRFREKHRACFAYGIRRVRTPFLIIIISNNLTDYFLWFQQNYFFYLFFSTICTIYTFYRSVLRFRLLDEPTMAISRPFNFVRVRMKHLIFPEGDFFFFTEWLVRDWNSIKKLSSTHQLLRKEPLTWTV